MCSLVICIIDLVAGLDATIVVAQLRLVEGLWLVKAKAVEGAMLVRVGVLLGRPTGAIPQLAVGRVAARQFVTGQILNVLHSVLVELLKRVTFAPIRAVVCNEGALETGTECGCFVVEGLDVLSRAHHSALAVAA